MKPFCCHHTRTCIHFSAHLCLHLGGELSSQSSLAESQSSTSHSSHSHKQQQQQHQPPMPSRPLPSDPPPHLNHNSTAAAASPHAHAHTRAHHARHSSLNIPQTLLKDIDEEHAQTTPPSPPRAPKRVSVPPHSNRKEGERRGRDDDDQHERDGDFRVPRSPQARRT